MVSPRRPLPPALTANHAPNPLLFVHLQYYHSRDVALRLKYQDELRQRSGPEAPGSPRHSRAAAGEAARQRGLGETQEQEEVRSVGWRLWL